MADLFILILIDRRILRPFALSGKLVALELVALERT